jgi:hypothetical protein
MSFGLGSLNAGERKNLNWEAAFSGNDALSSAPYFEIVPWSSY